MAKKPKNSNILRIAIAVGLPLVLIIVLVVIAIDTKNLAEDVVDTRNEVDLRVKQSDDIARLKEEAEQAVERRGALGNVLPQRDELFSFSSEIEELAAEDSVQVNFDFGSEGQNQIAYNLSASGGYSEIINFLDTIENDVPFMNLRTFNLSSESGQFTIDLNGSVFFNENGQE